MGKVNKELPVIKMTPKQAAAALALAGWPEDQWETGVAVGMGESQLDISVVNEIGASGWLQILKSAHEDLFKQLSNKYGWVDPVTNAKMAKKIYDGAGKSWRPWESYTGHDGSGSDGSWRQYQSTAKSAVADIKRETSGKSAAEKKKYYQGLFTPLLAKIAGVQLLQGVKGVGEDIVTGVEGTGEATAATGSAVVDAVADIAKQMAAFSNFFQALLLPGTWLRIGAGLVGIMLIVGGIVTLGKEASASS